MCGCPQEKEACPSSCLDIHTAFFYQHMAVIRSSYCIESYTSTVGGSIDREEAKKCSPVKKGE